MKDTIKESINKEEEEEEEEEEEDVILKGDLYI